MKNLACYHFEDNLVAFNVNRINETKLLWLNKEKLALCEPDLGKNKKQETFTDESFLAEFSYGIHDTEFFKDMTFDQSDCKTLLAERYGGEGLMSNGGGVRCGNLGAYQIKGIGKNMLAGADTDEFHSYGGLSLVMAIVEIVYANLLDRLLPNSAVVHYGLILTPSKSALYDSFEELEMIQSHSALLVRETCLRPAHFLRAGHFAPTKTVKESLSGDVDRTRRVNQKLKTCFSSKNEFMQYIGHFLSKNANQFAFARMARLSHGILTPSNFTMDGRWLDLGQVSFIASGENSGVLPFYDEADMPATVLNELFSTYSKYNKELLNPAPLCQYYYEQFQAYCFHHLSFLVAVPVSNIDEKTKKEEWAKLVEIVLKIICLDPEVKRTRTPPNSEDPLLALIKGLYLSMANPEQAMKVFQIAYSSINEQVSQSTLELFPKIFKSAFRSITENSQKEKQLCKARAIIALRKALLAGVFFNSNVRKYIEKTLSNNELHKSGPIIDSYEDAAKWIFSEENPNNQNHICILKTQHIYAYYDDSKDEYALVVNSGHTQHLFEKASELNSMIKQMKLEHTDVCGHSCHSYLNELCEVLVCYESKLY